MKARSKYKKRPAGWVCAGPRKDLRSIWVSGYEWALATPYGRCRRGYGIVVVFGWAHATGEVEERLPVQGTLRRVKPPGRGRPRRFQPSPGSADAAPRQAPPPAVFELDLPASSGR